MTDHEVVPEGPVAGPPAPDPAPPVAAPAETPATAAEAPPDLAGRLAELTDALVAVQLQLRSADDRAAGRERMIERLHEDNQRLRGGERRLVLLPVLTDLQRLRNDLLRQAAAVPPDLTAERTAELLVSYAHSVELTLERGGVVPIRPAPGDAFDGGRHRPADVVDAPDQAADGRVADVLADGYLDTVSGRALSPATVRFHRAHEPPAPALLPEEFHA